MCVLGGRGGTLGVTCGTPPDTSTTPTIYTTTTSSTSRKFFKNTYLMFYKLAKGTALAELKQHFLFLFLMKTETIINGSTYQLTKNASSLSQFISYNDI